MIIEARKVIRTTSSCLLFRHLPSHADGSRPQEESEGNVNLASLHSLQDPLDATDLHRPPLAPPFLLPSCFFALIKHFRHHLYIFSSRMPDSISTSSSSPRIPALSDLTLSSPNPSPSILTYSSFLDPSHSRTSTPAPPPAPSPTLDPSDPAFEFGEAVFHKRRAAWRLQAGNAFPQAAPEEETAAGGSSMDRLESLLDGPGGSDVGEEGWRAGLEGVHRGLLGGRSESPSLDQNGREARDAELRLFSISGLVKRMKLSLVIKVSTSSFPALYITSLELTLPVSCSQVLRAGWIRGASRMDQPPSIFCPFSTR